MGRWSSWYIENTIPPFAEVSNFERMIPVMGIDWENCLACWIAFCPLDASITRNIWYGSEDNAFDVTFAIFFNSSIKLYLVCSRPAVSINTKSMFRETADWIASKTTAPGSAPCWPEMTGILILSAHSCNWSIAAAPAHSPFHPRSRGWSRPAIFL